MMQTLQAQTLRALGLRDRKTASTAAGDDAKAEPAPSEGAATAAKTPAAQIPGAKTAAAKTARPSNRPGANGALAQPAEPAEAEAKAESASGREPKAGAKPAGGKGAEQEQPATATQGESASEDVAEAAGEAALDEPLRPSPEHERIGDLLKITSRLTDVLEREVEMLRAMRPRAMQNLQEQKIVLAAAYEAQLKTLRDHPEILGDLPEELRQELKRVTEHFHETLAENARALRAAKEATDTLLKGLIQAVEEQRQPCAAYADNGREAPKTSQPAISLAFNQQL